MCRKISVLVAAWWAVAAEGAIRPEEAWAWLAPGARELRLVGEPAVSTNGFGFDRAEQRLEWPLEAKALHGIPELTVGGWFFVKRPGEQYFLSRGTPRTAPGGERLFERNKDWVSFVLGVDQRNFLMGTIQGNGFMPFPLVTVEEIGIGEWHQLAVTKDAAGVHRLYRNGALVHSTEGAINSGRAHEFRETAEGPPVTVWMVFGGQVAEAWIFTNALPAREIAADFELKRGRYIPTSAPKLARLREMNAHYAAGLWPEELSATNWARHRQRIEKEALGILGEFPKTKVPLEPRVISEEDLGEYVRRKISIQVEAGDRMPFWLLVPKRAGRLAAVICFYGTSGGTGKDSVVGLTGREPGSTPHPNMSFAVDLARAGFVAVAADYLRDGERVRPGRRPYDTTEFYEKHPDWSIHGKDAWDTQRLIDYLETLEFVDARRIGMTGHSYGGHSTIFTSAIEPRIRAAVANGPVSEFVHHGMHWAVPAGAGASQSMLRLRPFLLDRSKAMPITFYEFTSLIAPRPLLVGQAAGERRPHEEENYAAVRTVYDALGASERLRYYWYAGDHDYPPEFRAKMVEWFQRWLK